MKNTIVKLKSLYFEELEERLVLTTTTGVLETLTYDQWRTTTFTLSAMEMAEHGSFQTGEAIPDGPSAYMNKADELIGLDRVHQMYPYSGAGYTVVVIDTGIDYNHPALGGGWGNRVIAGWDFVNNDPDPMDEQGHGTHVAGIIGSSNPTYPGIAPNVNLIALRVLDANGTGSFGAVEDALRWVVNHQAMYNIVAVNMSLGAGNYSYNPYTFLEDELSTLVNQGVFVAASSGNSFYSYNSSQGVGFPAISPNVVSVGAVWDASVGSVTWGDGAKDYSTGPDRITSFTQRGPALDILAPGAMITAAYRGGGYATLAGTSMASPMVAGAAALLHQAFDATGQSYRGNQFSILSVLQSTGVNVIDGDDEHDNVVNTGLTFKRMDLYNAMVAVAGVVNAPPVISPISDVTVPHGQNIDVPITVTDAENDSINLSAHVVGNNSVPANLYFVNRTLNIDLPKNYAGTFTVQVNAYDGYNTAVRTFSVTVTNSAPVIAEITDKVASSRTGLVEVYINAVDADSDPITYSASLTTPMWSLQQIYGFRSNGYLFFDMHGLQEKQIQDSAGNSYIIVPNGSIYRYYGHGNVTANDFVANVGSEVYYDLNLLFSPANPTSLVNMNLSGNRLRVTPNGTYAGAFIVTVAASDGITTSTRTFQIQVKNQAPVIAEITDKTIGQGKSLEVNLNTSDPDGDTFNYTVLVRHQLAELDQTYQFYSDGNLHYNMSGIQEKWFFGAGNQPFFVLPNGNMYRYLGVGSIYYSEYIARVGSEVYANPALLYSFPYTIEQLAQVTLNGSKLTIDPNDGFVGTFTVEVIASDWAQSQRETFTVTVTDAASAVSPITLPQISHQVISHKQTLQIPLSISSADVDGDSLSVTAQAFSELGALRQQIGMNNPTLYYNVNGIGEKWLISNGKPYFLMPDGNLYLYLNQGSIYNSSLVAHVGVDVYNDPSLLYNAPLGSLANVTYNNGNLIVTPKAGFTGTFTVLLTVSDGASVTSTSFNVTVTNAAPVVQTISDQTMSHKQNSIVVPVTISDADGDSLSVTAQAFTKLGALRQQIGMNNPTLYFNLNGIGEKWLISNGKPYFLMPDGNLYLYLNQGSIYNSSLVAHVGVDVYNDPSLLYNASLSSVANVTYNNGNLIVDPVNTFTGTFIVELAVTDGASVTSTSFNVTVTNAAPVIQPISDQTMSTSQNSILVPISISDADGDSLSVTTEVFNKLSALRSQLGINNPTLYFNLNGIGEKWLISNGQPFFLMPDGNLYLYLNQGSIYNSALVAHVGVDVYNNPSLLYNAPLGTIASVSYSGGKLTIDPVSSFVGTFTVKVNVTDGVATSTRSFNVTVTGAAQSAGAVSGLMANSHHDTAPVSLSAGEARGDVSGFGEKFGVDTSQSGSNVGGRWREGNPALSQMFRTTDEFEWTTPVSTSSEAGVHEHQDSVVVASPYTAYSQQYGKPADDQLVSEQVDGLIRNTRRAVSPRVEARLPELSELLNELPAVDLQDPLIDGFFG